MAKMFKMCKRSIWSGLTRKSNPWTAHPSVGQKIVNLIDTLKQIQENTLEMACYWIHCKNVFYYFFSCRQVLEAKAALYDKMAQGEIEGRM